MEEERKKKTAAMKFQREIVKDAEGEMKAQLFQTEFDNEMTDSART